MYENKKKKKNHVVGVIIDLFQVYDDPHLMLNEKNYLGVIIDLKEIYSDTKDEDFFYFYMNFFLALHIEF